MNTKDLKNLKFKKFEQALQTFEAVMEKDLTNEFFRDSAVQRFEYTIEIFWKMLKIELESSAMIFAKTPRDTIRQACGVDILTDEESTTILKMLKIRNETLHDYAVEISKILTPELPDFSRMLRGIFERIKTT